MKWGLLHYEQNGYDDSDGKLVYYDDETGKLGTEITWTTRCGGLTEEGAKEWMETHGNFRGVHGDPVPEMTPPHVLEAAREEAIRVATEIAIDSETRRHVETRGEELAKHTGTQVYVRRTVRKRKPQATIEEGTWVDLMRVTINTYDSMWTKRYGHRSYRALVRTETHEVWIDANALALAAPGWEPDRAAIETQMRSGFENAQVNGRAWYFLHPSNFVCMV